MTSCHDVTKLDLPIPACRCARESIPSLFPRIFKSLSSKMLLIIHFYDGVMSWRHVMTSCQYLLSPYSTNWSCNWAIVRFLYKFYVKIELLVSNKSSILILQAAASMSQRRVMTSQCDVMPLYEIEAILICLQFSHANWPGSHTYCSIVVYNQAKMSEMRFVIS
jgi:hypothetical protein